MSAMLYTSHLMLYRYNEDKELAERYLHFNLEKLIDTAIKATNNTSKYCTSEIFYLTLKSVNKCRLHCP
jgi:hypothetical protein